MTKYLLKRILYGIFSIIAVVAIVMVMIYGLLDRKQVFAQDGAWGKQSNNQKTVYEYTKWEEFGYLDFVQYAEWLQELTDNGELDEDTRSEAVNIGRTADKDSELVAEYVAKFTDYYQSRGYTVRRMEAVLNGRKLAKGGQQQLFAHKDIPLASRLLKYFTGLLTIDSVHYVEEDIPDRGLQFTWYDPVYGGEKFSPAIIGNGTNHKYLLYVDSTFPFIHQNIVTLNLGTSYSRR